MAETARVAAHRSVFAKLVAIMLAMLVGELVLVAWFFQHVVDPTMGQYVERLLGEHARAIAASAPDLEAAKGLGARLNVRIRYEGPDGTWSTSSALPTISEYRDWRARARPSWFGPPLLGRTHFLVPGAHGGEYLFSWEFRGSISRAHDRLLALLLALVASVVLVGHLVLRRTLRPLRALQDGVSRLSEGDLDVVLPARTRDEFGALTDAFNHMAGRVKEMLRARDQLLLDVSHELRSPLTRMKVALALLPDGEKKARMGADVAEMEAMLAELLELERLRDGRGIRTERRDLVALVREVAARVPDPPGVRVAAPGGEASLEIDADRVRTVIRNLLENAAKYSLPDSGPVEVAVAQDAGTVSVRVRDDGPGIPEEDLPSLFEPFFRVDRSRSKKTGGYGLGLSICKRIMEAHGGRIEARNNPGRGAVFTLVFPRPR